MARSVFSCESLLTLLFTIRNIAVLGVMVPGLTRGGGGILTFSNQYARKPICQVNHYLARLMLVDGEKSNLAGFTLAVLRQSLI